MTTPRRTSRRAVGYVRVSTADQAENGFSLDQQRKSIKRWCENNNLELVHIYADEGVSGAKTDRPEFARMLADVLADGFSHVVATKIDRLSRSANDLLATSTALEAAGVDLALCEQGIDTSTPMGKLMRTMLAAFAEFERDMLSERVKAGMAEAKSRGKKVGAVSKLPDDVRAYVHKLYKDIGSYSGVATRLNEEKVPTAGGGKAWYASQVRFLITGQRYGS